MGCLSSTLIYSDSGIGKTGQCGSFAIAVKQMTGKKTRYYTTEPGGVGTIEHLADAGLMDLVDVASRPNSFESLDFACRGYIFDQTGKPIAPTDATWEEFGGLAFDGATGAGEMLLDELRIKGADNAILGAEKAPQQFTSGSLKIAGSNQTHYGIVQSRVRKSINDCQRLPVHILWTARELKVTDADTRQPIYGPLLAGKACTLDMPAWFGNCIHLCMQLEDVLDPITRKMGKKPIRRAYFFNHFDGITNVPYLAKLRLPPEMVSEMPESIILDPNLGTMPWLFTKIEELREKAKNNLRKHKDP
jgi:hypothetical protein